MTEGPNYAFGDYWANRKVDTVQSKITPNAYDFNGTVWSMSPGGSQAGAIATFALDTTTTTHWYSTAGGYVYATLRDVFANPEVARWVPVGAEANSGYNGIQFAHNGLYSMSMTCTAWIKPGVTTAQMVPEKMIYAGFDGWGKTEGGSPYSSAFGIDTVWLDANEGLQLSATSVFVAGPGTPGVTNQHRLRPMFFTGSNPWEITRFDVTVARLG